MLTSFALVIVLVIALVAIAGKQMADIRDNYDIVIKHPVSLEMELREFQSEYRDLRRISATLAFFSSQEADDHEALFAEAVTAYNMAVSNLADAEIIISGNPKLTRAEKDIRLEGIQQLRDAFTRFHDQITLPLIDAVRANDRETALTIADAATSLAPVVMEKVDAVIALATEAANNQIAQTEAAARSTLILLLVISAIAVALAVAIAFAVSNYIGKSLGPLTRFMNRAASEGDIDFRPEWADVVRRVGRNQDELGQVTAAAAAFFGRVTTIGQALHDVSNGDLTSELPLLSRQDSMGLAFRKMQDNLNAMCGDITVSSLQVAAGASQVTAGAQALSTGATEQAASIEELSDAISLIAERTEGAARMAGQAAQLAGTIKDNAEKSRRRMEEMLTAAGEISEASEAIRKIIKTIDEIAFQTNLLAVNASVEAAHAGRHGKGFSVVAESVRGLALKSAEAAKETERLIANSMEKAGVGVAIAREASESLAEIVAGINENSRLVSTIAQSSEEQSRNIGQINIGISQVSNVVRQNSVTAEQSAAASEEMCGQSAMLQQLVSQFTLKG